VGQSFRLRHSIGQQEARTARGQATPTGGDDVG